MNAQTLSATMRSGYEKVYETMLRQFFCSVAINKIDTLLKDDGFLEHVDEEVATVRCNRGVAEVCTFGSVRWIE